MNPPAQGRDSITSSPTTKLSRRAFLRDGSLLVLGTAAGPGLAATATEPASRVGLVTDLHYADKDPRGTRHYRETPGKLAEAGAAFAKHAPAHVIELGDFIDAADTVADELRYLRTIQERFALLPGRKHYVLGNHCVDTLTKEEFLGGVGQEHSYRSFDSAGFHFVLLDACFRADGTPYQRRNFQWTDPNLPAAELEWLAADLRQAARPTVVFVHQRLDVGPPYGVRNAPAVRRILEAAGTVRAVFQGHSHKNDHHELNGIHYTTLVAMVEGAGVENNGYSLLNLFADGTLSVTGFRRQKGYERRRSG